MQLSIQTRKQYFVSTKFNLNEQGECVCPKSYHLKDCCISQLFKWKTFLLLWTELINNLWNSLQYLSFCYGKQRSENTWYFCNYSVMALLVPFSMPVLFCFFLYLKHINWNWSSSVYLFHAATLFRISHLTFESADLFPSVCADYMLSC